MGSNPTQSMDDCVCVYFVFVLSSMYEYVVALQRADHLCKVKGYKTEEEATALQKAVEPLMNE
jgi:hypothetical protein